MKSFKHTERGLERRDAVFGQESFRAESTENWTAGTKGRGWTAETGNSGEARGDSGEVAGKLREEGQLLLLPGGPGRRNSEQGVCEGFVVCEQDEITTH